MHEEAFKAECEAYCNMGHLEDEIPWDTVPRDLKRKYIETGYIDPRYIDQRWIDAECALHQASKREAAALIKLLMTKPTTPKGAADLIRCIVIDDRRGPDGLDENINTFGRNSADIDKACEGFYERLAEALATM